MRIAPVNTINSQNNYDCAVSQNKSFKGEVLNKALKETEIPTNLNQWRKVWTKLMKAVQNEPRLKIINKPMFNELVELTDECAVNIGAFFYNFNLDKKPSNTVITIATDGKEPILSYTKGRKGSFIEFTGGKDSKQLGFTDFIDGQRYRTYEDEGIYIDFYKSGDVRMAKPRTSDAQYYREDGSRDYFGGLKRLIKDIFD